MRAFCPALRRERYDAIIDLQGLTKSALIARLARGTSYGLANRTDGASHESPARWLVTQSDPGRAAQPRARPRARARRGRARHARRLAAVVRAGARVAGRRARPRTVVLDPRHVARRQALAGSELDRARPAPRRRGLGGRAAAGERRGRQARARDRRGDRRRQHASGRRWSSARSSIASPRPPARSASTAGRATSPSRSACRTSSSTTSRPRGAPARSRAHSGGRQVSVEGEPVPTVAAVWAAWKGVQSAAAPCAAARPLDAEAGA